MNIFYLHNDPKVCAELHVDKHVVKMIVEYAQLLSTAKRMTDGIKYEAKSKTGRKVQRYRLENPNNEVRPVLKEIPGFGLNKQIAMLIINTYTESAGTNLLILRS